MMRTFAISSAALTALLLSAAGVWAGSSAWTSGYQGPTGTGYHPSYYGYPLGEQAAGYYGGGRYNEFYNYGRGYGVANYPGPLPGRGLPPDYRGRPMHHGFVDPLPPVPAVKASPLLQGDKVAHIRIEVPAEDAQVWIEDQRTQQAGKSRWFVSPALEKHQQFEYRIRARWTENGQAVEQTQRINVGAGDSVSVGFPTGGKKDVVATPAAPPQQFPLSD